jgi:glycosyltransferase involved in cell wall biosynthesis
MRIWTFFLFPTKYVNEADPLVIHEALRNGVYVIACERGAIAETLGHGAGLAVPHEGFCGVRSRVCWCAECRPRSIAAETAIGA